MLAALLASQVEDASKWPDGLRDSILQTRRLYASPLSLCAAEDIASTLGAQPAPLPSPILAIASTLETASGETSAKMRAWADLTSAAFALHEVETPHMDTISAPEVHRLVLSHPAVAPLLK